MKKYLFLLILVSFLAGCGSGGGGSAPTGGGDSNTGNNSGNNGGSKANPECSRTGKIAKFKVSEDGIYRVSYTDLYGDCSGLSDVDPSTINLSSQGEDVAIDYIDSNGNNTFDSGDYVEFYGKAIDREDGRFRFTETNVYWLSLGEKAGKRMSSVSRPPLPTGPSSFEKVSHIEEDNWYEQKDYPAVTSPDEVREHWYWGEVFYPQQVAGPDTYLYKRDYSFSTLHIDLSHNVSLKIRFQSVSGSHDARVYINGHLLSELSWDSEWPYEIEVNSINPASFDFKNSGQNTLTIESVSGGLFYLDWFEVAFYHTYLADGDALEFTGSGEIRLSNFTNSNISVYEVSDPGGVMKINPAIKGVTPSNYEVKFYGSPDGSERFLALTSSKKKTQSVEIYTPADIKSRPSGFAADYVIITHQDFYDAIIPLANYRANEGGGYSVLTVKTKDIYDEFGYGIETPQAIRDFLSYAYNNWATRYVLLAGDATFDYKDISNYGASHGVRNYVPAYLYNYPGLGEVPGDNWFADVDNSNGVLPEMSIGRIPAKSPADITAAINKIKSHEQSSSRSNGVLLVADAVENEYGIIAPENEQIFEALSDSIEAIIPADYTVTKTYRSNYSGDFKYGLISEIDSGQLIVNYTGHGSVVDWTKADLFSSGDVSLLANNDHYPFVVALNCLNGYFVLADDNVEYPDPVDSTKKIRQYPSLAETFLLAEGKGAVAVWAASAIGYPSEHDPLAKSLYNLIFNENINVLGDVVTEAKIRAYADNVNLKDAVQTFIFFGDPATRLK